MSNGTNGRRSNGQFARGNPGGPGGNHFKRALEMKDAFMAAVTPEDMRNIAKRLLDIALHGEPKYAIAAIRELLNRLIGKPATEPTWEDTSKPQPTILVTTTAEAIKKLEENRALGDDPLRGLKRLSDRNADG